MSEKVVVYETRVANAVHPVEVIVRRMVRVCSDAEADIYRAGACHVLECDEVAASTKTFNLRGATIPKSTQRGVEDGVEDSINDFVENFILFDQFIYSSIEKCTYQ